METTNETKAKQQLEEKLTKTKNDIEIPKKENQEEPPEKPGTEPGTENQDAKENGDDKKEINKKKSEYEGSVVIWRGVLEWTEPIRKNFGGKTIVLQPDNNSSPDNYPQNPGSEVEGDGVRNKEATQKNKELICKLLVWDMDDRINELKRNLPDKLTMTLMRKQFIRNTDKSFFHNSTRTLFDMEACDKLNSLTRFMNNGYFGCIFFSSKPNGQSPQPQLTTKHNKVCTLHYAAERQMYIGFFLNDTTNFLNRMHEIIQYQKGIATFFNPGKITVPNPVVSSFYKDFIVEEYKGELIQQLKSIPRIKEERKERAKMCHENSQSKKVRERKKFLEKQKIRQQKQLELEQEQEAEKKLDEMMKFQNEVLEQMPRKIGKKVKMDGTKIEEIQQIFGPKGERREEAVLQSEMNQLKVLVRQRLNNKQKVVKVLGLKHLEAKKGENNQKKVIGQKQLKDEEQQCSGGLKVEQQTAAVQNYVEKLKDQLNSAGPRQEQQKKVIVPEPVEVEEQQSSGELESCQQLVAAQNYVEELKKQLNSAVPIQEQQNSGDQTIPAEIKLQLYLEKQRATTAIKHLEYVIELQKKRRNKEAQEQQSFEDDKQSSDYNQKDDSEGQNSVEKVEQQNSIEQVEKQDSVEQVEQQNSVEQLEPQNSVEQLEQQDSVEQLEQQDSAEPVEQQESAEPLEQGSSEPVEQQDSVEPLEQDSAEPVEEQSAVEQVEQQNAIEHVEQQDSVEQVEQQGSVEQLEQENSAEQKEQQNSNEKKQNLELLQPQNFITQEKLVEQQNNPELKKFVEQNSVKLPEFQDDKSSTNSKQNSGDDSKSKDKAKKQKNEKVVILQEHKKQKETERKKEDKKSKKQQQQKLKEQKNLLKTINNQHNHLHHHHHVASLTSSGIVAKKIEKSIPLLVTQKHSILWQGLLEWHEKIKCPGENNKQIRFNVLCQMLSHTSATNAELKMNLWPPKLIMQLIPMQLINSIDKNYFLKTKHIFCNLISCTTLDSLINSMKTGKIGLILFKSDQQSTSKCDIRVFILLYIEEKRAFFGSFPEDQITFANHLRKLIEYEKGIEAVIKQRHQRVENSNKQQTVVNLTDPSQSSAVTPNNSNNNNNSNSSNNNNNTISNNNNSNNNSCANGIVNSQKTEFDNLKNARQQNLIRIQLLKELLSEAEQQEVLYKSQIEINIRKNIEIARQEMKNKEEAQKGNKSNKS